MKRLAGLSLLLLALLGGGCAKPIPPGDPLAGLTPEQRDRFQRGRLVFQREFTPETGLGPLFNSTACGECHENPAAGGGGDETEVHATADRPDGTCDPLADEGGPVIQNHVTPALQAALGIDREPFPKSATARATRTSPALFGRGLLDAVPDSTLLAYADPDDRNHDGISGRVNRFVDGRIGRFGRKAFIPTLNEFNAGAFVIEMGITNPSVPTEESIGGGPIPPGVDPTPDPELSGEDLSLADDFVRYLAPPSPARLTRAGYRGRELFTRLGCAGCHFPTLRTGASPVAALNYRRFAAYTDLLLHDMGPEMADICLGLAGPSEFRTEPLIGLRFSDHFLHDGRAKSLAEAIAAHGGEGAAVRDRFRKLAPADSAALISFLLSL